MKAMICRQLGGTSNEQFHAETFDEIEALSKDHGTEMFQKVDKARLAAMEKMNEMMKDPNAMQEWMESKKKEFDSLPEDN